MVTRWLLLVSPGRSPFLDPPLISTVARPAVALAASSASGSRRAKGVVCSVALWIAAAVAVADYVKGVVWNAATTRDAVAMGLLDYGCPYLKGSGFATAALLTLVAAALGIRSFTMLLTPAAGAEPKHDGGEQPPVVAAGVGVVGENQQSTASAPPLPQGQAHAALV